MKMSKLVIAGLMFMAPFSVTAGEVSVTVKGMVCGFCAQGIEKKLKAVPSVEKVDISLKTKIVEIKTKDNQEITDLQIKEILKESGYGVEKIERASK